MKPQILDLMARENPYKCINYDDKMGQREDIITDYRDYRAYSLVNSEDTLDVVLLKVGRASRVVLHGNSIAATLEDTDAIAEKEAKSTFSPYQLRAYEVWKTGCEMPQDKMKWSNEGLQKHFASNEDSDDERPQKRSRKNESKEVIDEIQDMADLCERTALGELYKIPHSSLSLITREDIIYFRNAFESLCPLLDAMLIIVRTKKGLGSIAQKLKEKRQDSEFESVEQVLEAIVSHNRMIKDKVDAHFQKVDQFASPLRKRKRECDPEYLRLLQLLRTQGILTDEFVSAECGTANSLRVGGGPVLQNTLEVPINEDMPENGYHAPYEQHTSNHPGVEANGHGAASDNNQSSRAQQTTLPENNAGVAAAPSDTLQHENTHSDTAVSSNDAGKTNHPTQQSNEVVLPQNGPVESADVRPQAQTQGRAPTETADLAQQGQNHTTEQLSRIFPGQFDFFDSLLPPAMRANPISPSNERAHAGTLEAEQQGTSQSQGKEGFGRTAIGQQQGNGQKEREVPPFRSSSSEPSRPPSANMSPPTWANTFRVPENSKNPQVASPPASSNSRHMSLAPRPILKKTSLMFPPKELILGSHMSYGRPASITEIEPNNSSMEHDEVETQVGQSSKSPDQPSAKSVVHDKSLPFTTHKVTYF